MAYAELKTTDTIRFIDTRRKKYKVKKKKLKNNNMQWHYGFMNYSLLHK